MKKSILLIALLIAPSLYAGPRERLAQAFKDAGIPVNDVSVFPVDDTLSTRRFVKVDFQPAATDAQRQQAQAIIDGFNLAPRPRPTHAQVLAKWNALTAAQRTAATAEIIAYLIQNDPALLQLLGFQAD